MKILINRGMMKSLAIQKRFLLISMQIKLQVKSDLSLQLIVFSNKDKIFEKFKKSVSPKRQSPQKGLLK